MQGQVAKIIGDSGKDAVLMFKRGTAKDHPQQYGQSKIENQVAEISVSWSRGRRPETAQNKSAAIGVDEQHRWQKQNDGAESYGGRIQPKTQSQKKANRRHERKP